MKTPAEDTARLDKWLWAARIFKTRQVAVKAINGGHVELNGHRIKPARLARVGDVLSVRKGAFTYTLTIERISDRRGPAGVAQSMYSETERSISERQRLARELKTRASQVLYDAARPDSRTVRQSRMHKRRRSPAC